MVGKIELQKQKSTIFSGSRSSWNVHFKIPLCTPPCADSNLQSHEMKQVRKEIIYVVTFSFESPQRLAAELAGEVCSEGWRQVGRYQRRRPSRRSTALSSRSRGIKSAVGVCLCENVLMWIFSLFACHLSSVLLLYYFKKAARHGASWSSKCDHTFILSRYINS